MLDLIPDDWPIQMLQDFLIRSLRRSLHDHRNSQIVVSLSRGENVMVCNSVGKEGGLDNRHVLINFLICNRPIARSSISTRTLVRSTWIRNLNATNAINTWARILSYESTDMVICYI